ncbi:MAG: DUF885 domain-containing protein [Acidimicrobiia bacterium]
MMATSLGVSGSDHDWDDMSPVGRRHLADLARRAREALEEHLDHPDDDQRLAAVTLSRFLDTEIAHFDSDDYLRDVSHISCGFTVIRDLFDIMPRDTAEGWENIATRLATIGQPLRGWTDLLAEGVARGEVVARRQVDSVIEQAELLAGDESMFLELVKAATDGGFGSGELEAGAAVARREASRVAGWLRTDYLPHADLAEGVGEERYVRSAERFLGKVLDPLEVYSWGWDEIARLHAEMVAVAGEIDSSLEVEDVYHMLDTDPHRCVPRDEFTEFVQGRLDQAVVDLAGNHFDVPDPIRRVTVSLAPPGGALGASYINPSVDWERPGSVWYALGSQISVPVWQEVSTAYHEGFPGHHLQVGTAMFQADHLSKAQRLLIWYPGHGEGWALYAERLMDELGYLEKPEYKLGMLASQQHRAVRVVVDIGLHLGYEIPNSAPLHPGSEWTFERAVDYVNEVGRQPREVAESEVCRYLGWPGQAISYKVGEREILDIRRTLEERELEFDLKDFHRRVLEAGTLRLDHLRERMLAENI